MCKLPLEPMSRMMIGLRPLCSPIQPHHQPVIPCFSDLLQLLFLFLLLLIHIIHFLLLLFSNSSQFLLPRELYKESASRSGSSLTQKGLFNPGQLLPLSIFYSRNPNSTHKKAPHCKVQNGKTKQTLSHSVKIKLLSAT